MSQTATVEQLAERMEHLEQEVISLQSHLGLKSAPGNNGDATPSVRFADKQKLRQAMKRLLTDLAVQGEAIGAEKLQEMMKHSGLEKDELSRSLIEARDE